MSNEQIKKLNAGLWHAIGEKLNIKRVIIETPYSGEVSENLDYLRRCMADSLKRGEAPFASHGLYTQRNVLDDNDPKQRKQGIEAGFAWREAADATICYIDNGISDGVLEGLLDSAVKDIPIIYRSIYGACTAEIGIKTGRLIAKIIEPTLKGGDDGEVG